MATRYVQPSEEIGFVCGNCGKMVNFSPRVPIVSDSYGAYYLVNTSGEHLKLEVVEIQYGEAFQPVLNEDIPDSISVRCPNCSKFSYFAVAVAIIVRGTNGKADVVLTTRNRSGVHELPIVLMQRLYDDRLLPLSVMDMFFDAEE
ncbi:MAG: hypothetical protein R6V59_09535 [Dehalococcoidia bacterium]